MLLTYALKQDNNFEILKFESEKNLGWAGTYFPQGKRDKGQGHHLNEASKCQYKVLIILKFAPLPLYFYFK